MQKAGKYEIVRKIGAGGFGVVYEGRDPFIKRRVAIKTCTTEDEEIRQRFHREAEIAGNLQHKNIVTIHDFGIEDGVPYLVQEYLTGEDLEHVIQRGEAIPLERKLDILIQAAHGLTHAHAAGVIHRDIKPANIRLLEGGHVKILDFGIAKLAHVESRLTKEGMAVGTAAYLPPEQIRGDKVDFRADVFSFGVVAYELLAMVRPFDGKTISTLLYQILSQTPRPLTEALPGVPPRLAAIVDRCLDKDVEKRFASFAEVAVALESLLAESAGGFAVEPRPTPAAPTELWTRTETIVPEPARAEASSEAFGTPIASRPPRKALLAAIAAGVALLAIGGVLLFRAREASAPATSPASAQVQLEDEKVGASAPSPATAADRPASTAASAGTDAARAVPPPADRPSRPESDAPEPPKPSPEPTRRPPADESARERAPSREESAPTGPRAATPPALAEPAPVPPAVARPEPVSAPAEGPATREPTTAPAPVAPAPATEPAAAAPALSPEDGVRQALTDYVAAFNRLDKAAVRKIFPTVPDENFEGLADFQSYRMDLAVSRLDVKLPRVLVEARITHTWVTFSGKRDSSTRKEKMTFLQGPDGAWMRVQ